MTNVTPSRISDESPNVRQGTTGHNVRYVLLWYLAAAVVSLGALVLFTAM